MVIYVRQFLVFYIIIFCVHMIYFYFRNKSKKYKNIPTIEMSFLMRIYGIDVKKIGFKFIQKHISIINSIITSIDLIIYYNMENEVLKLFIVFITTFILISILYSALGKKYRKMFYRWGGIWKRYY